MSDIDEFDGIQPPLAGFVSGHVLLMHADPIRYGLLGKSQLLPSGNEPLNQPSIAFVMKSFGHRRCPKMRGWH